MKVHNIALQLVVVLISVLLFILFSQLLPYRFLYFSTLPCYQFYLFAPVLPFTPCPSYLHPTLITIYIPHSSPFTTPPSPHLTVQPQINWPNLFFIYLHTMSPTISYFSGTPHHPYTHSTAHTPPPPLHSPSCLPFRLVHLGVLVEDRGWQTDWCMCHWSPFFPHPHLSAP